MDGLLVCSLSLLAANSISRTLSSVKWTLAWDMWTLCRSSLCMWYFITWRQRSLYDDTPYFRIDATQEVFMEALFFYLILKVRNNIIAVVATKIKVHLCRKDQLMKAF